MLVPAMSARKCRQVFFLCRHSCAPLKKPSGVPWCALHCSCYNPNTSPYSPSKEHLRSSSCREKYYSSRRARCTSHKLDSYDDHADVAPQTESNGRDHGSSESNVRPAIDSKRDIRYVTASASDQHRGFTCNSHITLCSLFTDQSELCLIGKRSPCH
jgi:hypothetical protein